MTTDEAPEAGQGAEKASPGHAREEAPRQARGPGDDRAERLIHDRFHELMRVWPGLSSYLGLHAYDSQLPDMSRDAVVGQIDAERHFLAELAALDPASLSPRMAFERDLAGSDQLRWTEHVQKVRATVERLKLRIVISPRQAIMGAL